MPVIPIIVPMPSRPRLPVCYCGTNQVVEDMPAGLNVGLGVGVGLSFLALVVITVGLAITEVTGRDRPFDVGMRSAVCLLAAALVLGPIAGLIAWGMTP